MAALRNVFIDVISRMFYGSTVVGMASVEAASVAAAPYHDIPVVVVASAIIHKAKRMCFVSTELASIHLDLGEQINRGDGRPVYRTLVLEIKGRLVLVRAPPRKVVFLD